MDGQQQVPDVYLLRISQLISTYRSYHCYVTPDQRYTHANIHVHLIEAIL